MKDSLDNFTTQEDYQRKMQCDADLYSRRGWLLFVSCDEATDLARNVRNEYHSLLRKKYGDESQISEIPLMENLFHYFEDNGLDGSVPKLTRSVSGADAFVFQNCMDKRKTRNSLDQNIMQLYKLICTLKDYETSHITVITPYYPYSRQDKTSFMEREVALAQNTIHLMKNAGVDRMVCYHPHSTGILPPFKYVSGLDLFVELFEGFRGLNDTIVCSLDAGGTKENKILASTLNLDFLPGIKDRPEKKVTESLGVAGDINGKKRMIMTDDETASFGSCLGLMEKAVKQGIEEFHVAISHMRLGTEHIYRLKKAHEEYGMKCLYITDSIPQKDEILNLSFIKVSSLSRRWAFYINKTHYDESSSGLFFRPEKRR